MHVAIIPARSGSQGVPDKNLLRVWEHHLIGWAALSARQAQCFDAVILSTDSERYAEEGQRYGCQVPFLRPPELSADTTPMNRVLQHLLAHTPQAGQWTSITLLQPTCPLRSPELVRRCVHALLSDDRVDGAVTVSAIPLKFHAMLQLVENDQGHLVHAHPDGGTFAYRQQLKPTCYRNGAVYALRADSFRQSGEIIQGNIRAVMTEEPLINIDHPEDVLALRAYEANHAMPDWGRQPVLAGERP
jgi:N-acylneuraminate cytidylyltransferase